MTYSCIPIPSGFIFAIDGMAYYKVKQSDDVWFCFRVATGSLNTYGEVCPYDDFNALLSIEPSAESAVKYISAICDIEVDYIDKRIFKHERSYGRSRSVGRYYDKWMIDLGSWDQTPWGPICDSEQEAMSVADRLNYESMIRSVGREQAKERERRYMLLGIIEDRLTYNTKRSKLQMSTSTLFA